MKFSSADFSGEKYEEINKRNSSQSPSQSPEDFIGMSIADELELCRHGKINEEIIMMIFCIIYCIIIGILDLIMMIC